MLNNNPVILGDRLIQIVALADDAGNVIDPNVITNLKSTNGVPAGTLFNVNFVVASLIPTVSGNWAMGLPSAGFNYKIVTTGYWKIVNDGINLNGACECATGTDANGFFFGTSARLNRYENGRLAFYLGTFSFENVLNSNGAFEVLVGAMLPGLASDNQADQIKEGLTFGYVRKTGELTAKKVLRVYKNFNIAHEEEITSENFPIDFYNLKIYTIRFGYLGIHPYELYCADTVEGEQKKVFSHDFPQNVTSVSSPDMAFGVYVKNSGNTVNLGVRNGSFSFGNIGNERLKIDSSARSIEDNFTAASLPAAATGQIIATYRIPEKVTMAKGIDIIGITTGLFRVTKTNQLLFFDAIGISNKIAKVQIFFAPAADQVGATYTPLNPLYNILERATGAAIGTVAVTNFKMLKSFTFNTGNFPIRVALDVSQYNFLLEPGTIAVMVVKNAQTVTEFEYTIFTNDNL